MTRRLDKTLADYIGIAISPALIMVMVGSLVFFLMELSYQGRYGERLHFILAMFVMAVVLVARLAIEFGSEHATMYGIPLAIVTALALVRFVDHGLLINIGLMALIWWSAHKLTWDCTLIDETEDASGEGLLQSAGLEATPAHGGDSADGPPKGVWQRVRERFSRKGPHAPGVWILYFSLAALPLFAVGELFLPKSDPQQRQYAFRLLFFYVGSGLALLMTTSFLGLRRYLRQRNLQMPATMARSWIAVGFVLVVILVVLAALLPRPDADYDESNIRLVFDSPQRQASEHDVLGGDGAEGQGASGRSDAQQPQEPSGREAGDAPRQGDQTRQSSDDKQHGREPRPKQGAEADGQPADEQGKREGGQPGTAGSPSKQSEQADRSPQPSDEKAKAEPGRNHPSDKKSDPRGKEKGETNNSKSEERQQSKSEEDQAGEPSPGTDESRLREEDRQSGMPAERQSTESKQEEQEEQEKSPLSENAASESSPSPSLMPRLELGSGWLVTLLRWLLYAVLAIVALVWAWRNRQTVIAAVGGMFQVLRDFWNRLFGRPTADEQAEVVEPIVKTPPRPRFAAYDDPFAKGTAGRMPPDELIRYTFEALEAWGRDQGCPREPDQTPHEFARAIAERAPQLGRGVRKLAELYSQAAYAPSTLEAGRVSPLRELWRELRAAASLQPM